MSIISDQEKRKIIAKYIEILATIEPTIAEHVNNIIDIHNIVPNIKERKAFYDKFIKFDSIQFQKIMEYYAKIIDISRRIRKHNNAELFDVHKQQAVNKDISSATADIFEYVFAQFDKYEVKPEVAEELFNANAIANFSLTMHPTNSTTVLYTAAGAKFDDALGTTEDYTEVLKNIINTRMVGPKKTTTEESQELIGVLEIIYNSAPKLRELLISALEKYPQYQKVINFNKPLIAPSVWGAGDGDGNDNADRQALITLIDLLRNKIKDLYIRDIDKLINDKAQNRLHNVIVHLDPKAINQRTNRLKEIRIKLINNEYLNKEQLIADLKDFEDVSNLIYKINTFGFNFTTIDIRHNAEDIMKSLAYTAKKAGVIENEDIVIKADQQEQLKLITNWFENSNVIEKFSSLDEKLFDKTSEGILSARIIARLKIVAENPSICKKFIVAETKSAANMMAVLLLLKITGTKVACDEAQIDLVTLSESAEDLLNLTTLTTELFAQDIYRKHLAVRKTLITMIAKSDTVRRSGRGAEGLQEEAIGGIYKLIEKIKLLYQEFSDIKFIAFNAGGASLQRGGGRVFETAHNYGRIARYFGAKGFDGVTMTIQGHQMHMLLSPNIIATQSLEAFVAQSLYAASQTKLKPDGKNTYVPPRTAPAGYKEKAMIAKFYEMCASMREDYLKLVGDPDDETKTGNPSFNQLLVFASWLSVSAGNLSSRPPKRGSSNDMIGKTVRQIIGESPKILNNRAITVDKLSDHSGTHIFAFLALADVLEKFKNDLPALYNCSKSFRDFVRNTAIKLYLTDYSHSWCMLIGQDRPSNFIEIQELARKFELRKFDTDISMIDKVEANKQTLAWLEICAIKVAKLFYFAIRSKDPYSINFTQYSLLEDIFSEVAQQLKLRHDEAEFAFYVENKLTYYCNKNPDTIITLTFLDTVKAAYAAADIAGSAPEGALNTALTRYEPKYDGLRSLIGGIVPINSRVNNTGSNSTRAGL